MRSITAVLLPTLAAAEERQGFVSAASALGADVEVLAISGNAVPATMAASLAQRFADPVRPRLVLLPAGTEGEAVAAQLAQRTGAVVLGRCTHLELSGDAVLARRAVFGGRAEVALRSDAPLVFATVRAASSPGAITSPLTDLALDEPSPLQAEPLPATGSLPRLQGAALVVSGGRGVNAPEGFEALARIARALGAGLGGSLPAVDAGLVPVAHQVGQSGQFVTPRVYFAVGISGTPQHLAGLAPGTRIVALNNDRDAPIFGRSDVAVEGDWRELLPLLEAELAKST